MWLSILITCDQLIAERITQVIISTVRGHTPTGLTETTKVLLALEICQTTFGYAE